MAHTGLTHIGPMALLADSQLLFGGDKGEQFSQWVIAQIDARDIVEVSCGSKKTEVSKKALYIGAANGNATEFYQMAVDICRPWGVGSVDSMSSVVHVEHASQLAGLQAEDVAVVILAGGDVALGWLFLSQPSVRGWLDNYTRRNGLVIGISAGAIHLASSFSKAHNRSVPFLAYCTANIAAHEEQDGWPSVCSWQQYADDEQLLYIGIPFGGGLLIEPNTTRLTESEFLGKPADKQRVNPKVKPIGKGYKVFEKNTPII